MTIDPVLKANIARSFQRLNLEAAGSFPGTGALSDALNKLAPPKSATPTSISLQQGPSTMFPKAGVDCWMRAVHSFLVSAALTDVSPIWASVAGYYSSHYSVRAIAHILGCFQLFRVGQIVQREFSGNQLQCTYSRKNGSDREHKIYWKFVKANSLFASDPLFTENDSTRDPSDAGHRDFANYKDFLQNFPTFHPLDRVHLRERIQKISSIEFTAPPIPSVSRYPDVESVQVVAYHRLVRFRELLDDILVDNNNFWTVHRNPPWARDLLDYQLVDSRLDAARVAGG
jgi:hypothetical protein